MALDDPPAGGQPPSDGMPSEPSEEAIQAALEEEARWRREMGMHDRLAPGPKHFARVLKAAYAAERGVSAVPPTEEPKNDT